MKNNSNNSNNSLYYCVLNLLQDRIQNIYLEMQNRMGITNGDVAPETALKETIATENIARIITETLEFQSGNSERKEKEEQILINGILPAMYKNCDNLSEIGFISLLGMLVDTYAGEHRKSSMGLHKMLYVVAKEVHAECGDY